MIIYLPDGHDNLESFLSSLDPEGEYSGPPCSDGDTSDMSNLTATANKHSEHESWRGPLIMPPSLGTSETSSQRDMPRPTPGTLTYSVQDSPANHSAQQEKERGLTTPVTCGPQLSSASAWYDRESYSWKTFQGSFLLGTLEPFSETWPKAGMIRDGVFYPQPRWELPILGKDSGLWGTPRNSDGMKYNLRDPEKIKDTRSRLEDQVSKWPTPYASDPQKRGNFDMTDRRNGLPAAVKRSLFPTQTDPSKGGGSSRSGDRHGEIPSLHGMARAGRWPTPTKQDASNNGSPSQQRRKSPPLNAVAKWPTPTSADANRKGADYARENRPNSGGDDLNTAISRTGLPGGKLNPEWVEWLMGWPIEWSALKPSEMGRSPYAQPSPFIYWLETTSRMLRRILNELPLF